MLSLPLLIQLFGREVIDSLERSGFDDESRICAAGAVRLAAESGIALPVAQRIVAVVEEMLAASPAGTPSETAMDEARKDPSRAARRPASHPGAKEVARKAAAKKSRRVRIEVKAVPEFAHVKEAAGRPTSAEQASGDRAADDRVSKDEAPVEAHDDPFVDDVALVSWMGFSSKTSSGRLPFSVADGILDHLRRERPIPESDGAAAARDLSEPTLRPADEPPTRLPAPRLQQKLPGSFWNFGGNDESAADPGPELAPSTSRASESSPDRGSERPTESTMDNAPDGPPAPPTELANRRPDDLEADHTPDPPPQTSLPRRRIRHDH